MLTSLKARVVRLHRDEGGAVAVEFALLAPMLFALLFGIVCLGYAAGLSHSIHQLATSTARASIEGLTQTERRDIAEAYLQDAHLHYPLLNAQSLQSVLTFSEAGPPHVTVEITYALDTSVLSLADGFLGLNLSTLKSGAYLAY